MTRQSRIIRLLKKLRSDQWDDVFEAGTTIYQLKGTPYRPVVSVLENFADPYNREYAAYALITLLLDYEHKIARRRGRRRTVARRRAGNAGLRIKIERIIKSLLKVIDRDAAPKVRAQALETLGMSSTAESERYKLRRRIEKSVVAALSDETHEVRFWACYAAGRLKIKSALPRLQELAATDDEDWGQWWYVSEEAADAIEWIGGRDTEPRIPVAQRGKTEN